MTFVEQLLTFVNAEVSLDPTAVVEADTDLLLSGLVDSLGVVRIVHWLETTEDLMIDPVEVVLDNFQTVTQMAALIDRLKLAVE